MWLKIFCSKKHLLLLIIKQQKQIMADFSKLNDAVTNLNTTVGQAVTIIGNSGSADQPDIDSVTDSINTASTTLANAIAAIQPPPPPAS